MLKTGKYIGDDRRLRGKTALVMTIGYPHRGIVPEGKVIIQTNDVSTGLGHGWHEFPAEDWEVKVFTL